MFLAKLMVFLDRNHGNLQTYLLVELTLYFIPFQSLVL